MFGKTDTVGMILGIVLGLYAVIGFLLYIFIHL